VGAALRERGSEVTLIVSEKEVDQLALAGESRFGILRLPAVGFGLRTLPRFMAGLRASYRLCRAEFGRRPPGAVLAMGGFTSVAPLLAGRRLGARLFLHDSNAIPGRANRWLSRLVDVAFVGFADARRRLRAREVEVTGTPVRPELRPPASPSPARVKLGLDPLRPVLLVMGGSQGARGVNQALIQALPTLSSEAPELQYLHLTGPSDLETVEAAHRQLRLSSVVRPFLSEMDLALGAATLVVSRAGASSLAEFGAMALPAILIPFPFAADDHQTANARAVAAAGAALWMPQSKALEGTTLAREVLGLLRDPSRRDAMSRAAADSSAGDCAHRIAERICTLAAGRALIS
jgi:UDP-N-acetylglucosamine--N-acetylmuramyl-(pentapeptide) pyrophosphoryl-undecaprenol N-acetylglucosamine transferase